METSCLCSPGHGPTAPPVSSCHRWSFEKSWSRSCPCRVSTSYATAAVESRIARCEPRSFLHYASRVWTGRRLKLALLLTLGQAAGPRIGSGYDNLSSATVWAEGALRPSVLPTWRTADHCRHHPGVGNYTHPTSSQARAVPPPIAPARYRQEIFAFDSAHASVVP
jgi:hypothetical protein